MLTFYKVLLTLTVGNLVSVVMTMMGHGTH